MRPRIPPPLSDPQSATCTQDCFYRPLSAADRELAYRQDYNFDHPNAFDFDHQINVLRELRAGSSSVAIPTCPLSSTTWASPAAERFLQQG